MAANKIDDFLGLYKSKNTIQGYERQLSRFFDVIGEDPNTYIKKGRSYQQDIEKYWNSYLSTKAPNTRNQAFCAIRMFLEHYLSDKKYAEVCSKKFFKRIQGRGKGKAQRTWIKDKVPTPEVLKTILQHTDIKGKALFLTLATSGMRIGEALYLKPKHIHLNETPVRIELPSEATKTGEARTTFITNEARDAINEWLKLRDKYVQYADKVTTSGSRPKNDTRIFPYSYQTAWEMWKRAIINAELAEKDKDRYRYHVHTLRKFFRSRLPKSIGVDMTEFLMGHSGYLTKEYRDYPDEELGKEYLKGTDRLLIFETEADTSDIREALQEKDKQMQDMQKTMKEMQAQIVELRLEKLEKANGIKKK